MEFQIPSLFSLFCPKDFYSFDSPRCIGAVVNLAEQPKLTPRPLNA